MNTPSSSGLAARRICVDLISEVLRNNTPLDDASNSAATPPGPLAALDARDRAFVRALATTTLRHLGQLDHVTGTFLTKPLPKKSGQAREILLTGAAQILFMRIPPHAAIDTAVRLAKATIKSRHLSGLINAVLRRTGRDGPDIVAGQNAARLNTPAWLFARWRKTFGNRVAEQIATAHLNPAALDITVKSDPGQWAARLGGQALTANTIRLDNAKGRIEDLPGYAGGHWWVQDAAASLPARLTGAVTGKNVLDLCAAPGGKTAQLASAGARVTALDISRHRLARLEQNLARLNLPAEIVCSDVLAYSPGEQFDAILLDAPCSATGTIRRHPDIPLLKSEHQISQLAALQAKMLDHAFALLRPGGTLVYCTCSLEPEEGPGQISAFLAGKTDAQLDPLTQDHVAGQSHLISPEGCLTSLPFQSFSASPGLDGFFAARIIKK